MDSQEYMDIKDKAVERVSRAGFASAYLIGDDFAVVEGLFGLGSLAETARLVCRMLPSKTDEECLDALCYRARGFVDTCAGGTLEPFLISAKRDGRRIFSV